MNTYLIMLTTSTATHLNTSKRANTIDEASIIARSFIESNNLGSSDMRGDFGEVYEVRSKNDGYGDEAKHIGYINYNGTFAQN
jgi:hypothetical protein